jgi:CBS domain-containing protein
MFLRDILNVKGKSVFTISVDANLSDVVKQLVQHNVGSLVVCRDDEIVGIVTERDILRTVAEVDEPLEHVSVRARMTSQVISGTPNDQVAKTMGLMTEKRIRHLPVLEDGKLAGLISIGDVVKAHHDLLTMENRCLMDYIQR